MFRNNPNRNLSLDLLRDVKRTLTEQRINYINLLNENRQMIETIDNYIYTQEMQQATRPTTNSTSRLLSNEEIFTYTTAHMYRDIEEPLNNICYITGRTFRDDDYVCKLPCGHLFDGNSIIYHLTRINSCCPSCHVDVIPNTERNNRSQQTSRQTSRQTTRQTPSTFSYYGNDSLSSMSSLSPLYQSTLTPLLMGLFDTAFLSNPSFTSMHIHSDNENVLTQEEIENATEELYYDEIDNPISDHCPISYTEFEPETLVCRIKHCQHIFQPTSLSEWLSRNTTCPVCRYNLKSQSNASNSHNNSSETINSSGNIYDISGNNTNRFTLYYAVRR
jgi:hypothetical protein